MRARILTVCLLAGAGLAQQTAPARRSLPQLGVYGDYRSGGTHVLALANDEAALAQSVREHRTYVAHEELGDPAGFSFIATNNNGVYDIGDRAPMIARTRLVANLPIAAHLRIVHNGATAAEADGVEVSFTPTETGAYHFEASVSKDGEMRPWIETAPIYLEAVEGRGITLPPGDLAPSVEARKDIPYVEGAAADANKHKLDLYLPKGKTAFPVLIFIHGGAWRSGDRSNYPALGNRFAKEGIGVVVPSYRLMPGAPHPAQIEDAVAAVDWVVRHIAEYGGDPKRLYLGGHSAGGHLAAYAGLEKRFWPNLKGVLPMSGVYDLTPLPAFQSGPDGSPMHRIAAGAPPFLITYCQNDYPSLPAEARNFHAALVKAGIRSELVYIPGKNHISEIVDVWRDDDLTARSVLRFINGR